jgi:hypothetical protein
MYAGDAWSFDSSGAQMNKLIALMFVVAVLAHAAAGIASAQSGGYRDETLRGRRSMQSIVSTGSQFGVNREMRQIINSASVRPMPNASSVSRVAGQMTQRAISAPLPGSKPFADVPRAPTLSPYLNLLREGEAGGLPNYFTFVRPFQEQQEANRRQQQQMQRLGDEVQSVSRQILYPGQEASAVRPTGFQTVFMNHLNYYNFGR